jgi:hypothetical protein
MMESPYVFIAALTSLCAVMTIQSVTGKAVMANNEAHLAHPTRSASVLAPLDMHVDLRTHRFAGCIAATLKSDGVP